MSLSRSNSPLTLFNVTLPAAVAGVPVITRDCLIAATGSKLFCKTALQPFKVKLDTGERFEMEDGFSYESDGNDFFKSIELANFNATALAVELYVGNARVFRAAPLFTREAPTATAGEQVGISALTGWTSPATAAGKHQKGLILGNFNTSNITCNVYKSTGLAATPIAFISPNTSLYFPTSDRLFFYNPHATLGVTGYFCQILYA